MTEHKQLSEQEYKKYLIEHGVEKKLIDGILDKVYRRKQK